MTVIPEDGSHKVLISKGIWVDTNRDEREVPYKIYYPEISDNQKTPVIFWSHGFGGSRDGASFISRYLASHGYHIVHMTHVGTDSSLWEGKPGHPWDILRETKISRAVTLNRFHDVSFVLQTLKQAHIAERMDFTRLGMSGHSFGALSTQVALGQSFPNEDYKYISLGVDSIKAGIAYSPVPIDHLGPDDPGQVIAPEDIYGGIDRPVLLMTGTEDSSPIGGAPYTHRFPVFDHAGSQDKFMLIKKGGDHMVYNGTRGKLNNNPNRDKHEEIIKMISLVFWDAFLKDDEKAGAWLEGSGVSDYLSDHGEMYVRSRD